MLNRHKNPEPTSRRRSASEQQRPATFSYRAQRSEQDYNVGRAQPRDQDVRRRERLVRFWRQRLGVLVAGVLVIFCIFDILHLSHNPKVIVLSSSSNQAYLRSTAVYEQAAAKLFASSVLNGNKITVNTTQVQQKLQQQFPELTDVSVTLPLISHRPIVYIAPTTPALIVTTNGSSYALSKDGVVLLNAAQLSDATKQTLPTITDQTNQPVTVGKAALPSADIAFIKTITGELAAKGVTITALNLPSAAYELDVQFAGEPYYVKFNMHDTTGARQQAGTFLAVKARLQQQGITPSSYVDARLTGRAYYK